MTKRTARTPKMRRAEGASAWPGGPPSCLVPVLGGRAGWCARGFRRARGPSRAAVPVLPDGDVPHTGGDYRPRASGGDYGAGALFALAGMKLDAQHTRRRTGASVPVLAITGLDVRMNARTRLPQLATARSGRISRGCTCVYPAGNQPRCHRCTCVSNASCRHSMDIKPVPSTASRAPAG